MSRLQSDPRISITFALINFIRAKLILYSDASFPNACNIQIQLGFVILLTYYDVRANRVHFPSRRWRRITLAVMKSEIQALNPVCDVTFAVQNMLADILGIVPHIKVFVESRIVLEVISKQGKLSKVDSRLTLISFESPTTTVKWQRSADSLEKPTLQTQWLKRC